MEWAIDARGRLPAKDFFDALDQGGQAKVMALFARMADTGRIANREHFKKVEETDLFEFKRFQVRLLGDYRAGRRFVVAHGVRKKQDRLSSQDIETARRILRENDAAEKGGGR